jgi:hypothetical protein
VRAHRRREALDTLSACINIMQPSGTLDEHTLPLLTFQLFIMSLLGGQYALDAQEQLGNLETRVFGPSRSGFEPVFVARAAHPYVILHVAQANVLLGVWHARYELSISPQNLYLQHLPMSLSIRMLLVTF